MTEFAKRLQSKLPAGMTLPEEFIRTFDWMEEQGHAGLITGTSGDKAEDHILALYPFDQIDDPGASHAFFRYNELPFSFGWSEAVAEADRRVFEFVTTGGDGSRAALWLDDEGHQRIVHIGSGSGSVWAGIISDDPLVLLQLLAIGYNEPCSDELHEKSASEATYEYLGVADAKELNELRAESDEPDFDYPLSKPPLAFRKFLESEFGVTVPERASDIISQPVPKWGETSKDPFLDWVERVNPETTSTEEDEAKQRRIDAANTVTLRGFIERIRMMFGR
ncbi:hypothetical protein [Ahrensia sp. R2A130]|uniref:hypothetical protein n=1 Tax=Ahrensia sp. R2A130 TaxID=744979 RepID=UPI0001E0F09C|nr:hypothetical protein [Ahrensia sp. R2A130]EFL89899.1 acyl-CoA dehydrogenase [Ahrensia sp. R2A130]